MKPEDNVSHRGAVKKSGAQTPRPSFGMILNRQTMCLEQK